MQFRSRCIFLKETFVPLVESQMATDQVELINANK